MRDWITGSVFFRQWLWLLLILASSGCVASRTAVNYTDIDQPYDDSGFKAIIVEGQERQYLLYIPKSYTGQSVPLVFNFHGSGSDPNRQVNYSDFFNLSEKQGFILVAPTGLYNNGGKLSWNTTLDPDGVDDIALVMGIIMQLSTHLAIDKNRIYAVGMSGGARMSSRVACELSETIAAVALIAGIQFPDDCSPSRAIPVIVFHGKMDMLNHYVRGPHSRPYWKKSVEKSVAGWVDSNGCNANPETRQVSDMVTRLGWNECNDGVEVVFYRIADGGHTWPGSPIILTTPWSGNTNTDINASELSWDFFTAHPLPE